MVGVFSGSDGVRIMLGGTKEGKGRSRSRRGTDEREVGDQGEEARRNKSLMRGEKGEQRLKGKGKKDSKEERGTD